MVNVIGKRFQKGDYTTPLGCTLTTADDVVIEIDLDVDHVGVNEDVHSMCASILNSSSICVKKFCMGRCCFIAGTIIKPYSPKVKLPVGTYTIGGLSAIYDFDCTGASLNCGSSRMAEVECDYIPSASYMKELFIQNLADCTTLTVTAAPVCTQPSCTMTIV